MGYKKCNDDFFNFIYLYIAYFINIYIYIYIYNILNIIL